MPPTASDETALETDGDAPPVAAVPPRDQALATPRGRAWEVGLHVLAFGAGFAIMAIEIAGARVMAPVFGLSAVPWTAVIGVILTALAVGNHLGGRLADARIVPLAWILAGAGVTAVIPVLGGPVPGLAQRALGYIPGAVASAVVLFALPILALGMVVPYLIRAGATTVETVGRRAGDVSAAATAGSIVGTFVTGFVLLPTLPLQPLLGALAALLLALAVLAGRLVPPGPPPGALILAALGLAVVGAAAGPRGGGLLATRETVYGSIQVVERMREGALVREMIQNGGSSSAEYVDTGFPAHPYARVSGQLFESVIERVDSVLFLGGAALSLPVALVDWQPRLAVDVVELDPAATALAREYFAYGRTERPGIRVFHDDARIHLARTARRYDVIYLDAFDHLVTVPWTLVTREAIEATAARLRPRGMFVANVLSPTDG
ncbi:MAG TPA: fused MFS/spermidine synthase, partial [Longimicrobiales bacterium]